MHTNSNSIFYAGCSTLLLLVAIASAQHSCFTPNNSYGNCVPIRMCTKIAAELIKYGLNAPQSLRDYLLQSRCTGGTSEIHICCDPAQSTADIINENDYEKTLNPNGLEILNALKCGVSNGDRIAYGENAQLGEFPWMAMLKYNTEERPFKCGGTLITHRYILTAAHCLVELSFDLVGVRLGEYNTETNPDCVIKGRKRTCMPPFEDYGIEKYTAHPEYSRSTYVNDVGLIKLDRDANFNKHIKPICLPITKRTTELQNEQQYIISGWGTTENGTAATVLMKAIVPHRDSKVCQDAFKRVKITDKHLCAGGDGRIDSCKGDSGGPLFFLAPYKLTNRFVQYGVVSFGVAKCGLAQAFPGVYASVTAQMPWITANLD